LTAHTEDNESAQISPDGDKIVYTSSRTGNREIWVLDLSTESERQLTDHPASDWGAIWSDDERRVIFVSDRGGRNELWSIGAEGGPLQKLGDVQDVDGVRLSPDGSTLGFIGQTAEGGTALMVMPVEGGESKEVLPGALWFGWYLDSSRVIATIGDGDEMCAVNLETGIQQTLLMDPQIELEVAPDGSAVSFCSATSHFNMNLHFLYLQRPEEPGGLPKVIGSPEKITHGDGEWHVHNGSWAPDMTRIVYTRDTDTGDIFLLEGVFNPLPGGSSGD
jgi:Tol biopolymer transport system component